MVSWEYPPHVIGGLGRHVGNLVEQLRASGHDVRVLAPAASAGTLTADGVLGQVADGGRELLARGRRLLSGWRPDIVHAHDWLAWLPARELGRSSGAKVVTTLHATESGRQQGWLTSPVPRAISAVERQMCQSSDAVLVCSRFMAGQAENLFDLPATTVSVIGNGASGLAGTIRRPEPELLVFAGRLVHEKGLQELVKALPLLRRRWPATRLVVAGDGPLLAAQQDRARRYGVADLIDWPGFLDDERLARLLGRAGAVVVPSLYEPFGLVALEAQLAEVPVAVSATGGLSELVTDGVTGVTFAPQDPRAVATAVDRLRDEPDRTRRMAAAAAEQARTRFSWPAVAARTAAVYRRLLAA